MLFPTHLMDWPCTASKCCVCRSYSDQFWLPYQQWLFEHFASFQWRSLYLSEPSTRNVQFISEIVFFKGHGHTTAMSSSMLSRSFFLDNLCGLCSPSFFVSSSISLTCWASASFALSSSSSSLLTERSQRWTFAVNQEIQFNYCHLLPLFKNILWVSRELSNFNWFKIRIFWFSNSNRSFVRSWCGLRIQRYILVSANNELLNVKRSIRHNWAS